MSCSSAGAAQVAQLARAVAEHVADGDRDARRRRPSGDGVGRLGVDDQREGLGDAVEPLVVGALDAVRGLEGADHARAARGRRASPERAVARVGAQRVDERGVEPAAAALGGDVERARAGRRRRRRPRRSAPGRGCGRAAGSRRRAGRRGSRRRPSARRARGSPRRSSRSARSCARSRRRARSAARSSRAAPSAPLRAIAASRRVRPWRDACTQRRDRAQVVGQLAGALELEVVGAEQRATAGRRCSSSRRP